MNNLNLKIVIVLTFVIGFVIGNYCGVSLVGRMISDSNIEQFTVPENSIVISPQQMTVGKGNNFVVQIDINTNKLVYAVQFELIFNPNVLYAVSANEGDFLKKEGNTYPVIKIDNDAGKIEFVATILGQSEGFKGQGTLVSIEFRSVNKGSSSLQVKNIILRDSAARTIAGISINDAEVTVV